MLNKVVLYAMLLLTSLSEATESIKLDPDQIAVENGLRYPILIANSENNKMTLQNRMDFYHVPGVSIAVIDKGTILWATGYGTVTHGLEAKPVNQHTLFQAASISKPITAFGALLLVQQGKISLDEDVNNYLKKWKIPNNDFTNQEKVTLRRLLSHTAGTNVHGFPGYAINAIIPSITEILDGIQPFANTDPIRVTSKPGSEFRYSGGGTTIIQLLIEDITGEGFDTWMQKNVLLPLGMTESTFSQPLPKNCAEFAAYGHFQNGEKVEGNWHIYPEMAPAGLWSTPTDLAKFILHIQATLKKETANPLNSYLIKEMITRQRLSNDQETNSGLGLVIDHNDDNLVFRHNGRNEGFLATLYGLAFRDQGVVIMINNDSAFGLMDEIKNSVADVYRWPNFTPIEKEKIHVDPNMYLEFCGRFIYEESEIEITVTDNRLFVDFKIEGSNKVELYPEKPYSYFMKQGEDVIEFVKSIKGNVDELIFISETERTVYKRAN